MLDRLGRAAARHPLRTIAAWLLVCAFCAVLAAGGFGGADIFSRLTSDSFGRSGEATVADELLEESADENVTPYKVERHRHTPEIEQELAGQGAPVTITFTPHLVPLAQGELVSCYVTPARDHDEAEVMALYDEAQTL